MISPAIAAVLVGDDREVELLGLHLAHQPVHGLVLGDEAHRPRAVGDRLVAAALALGPHEVLGVGEPDDVVVVARPSTGSRLNAVVDGHVERRGDRGVVRRR